MSEGRKCQRCGGVNKTDINICLKCAKELYDL